MNWRLSFWLSLSVLVLVLIITVLLLSREKFSLSLHSITAGGSAASYTMEIEMGAEWVLLASPDDDWCRVEPYMGNAGVSKITVFLETNHLSEERKVQLVFYAGNDSKEFLLKQQPAGVSKPDTVNFRAGTVPASATTVVSTVKPVLKPRPAIPEKTRQTATAVKSKPAPKPAVKRVTGGSSATAKPVEQKAPGSGKVYIQDVLKDPKPAQEEKDKYAKKEPVKQANSVVEPCVPAEIFQVKSTPAGNVRGLTFSLTKSQPAISYRLYRDETPISGFVPGKDDGSAIAFPDAHTEPGVYTVKSVAVSGYCATTMLGGVKLVSKTD